MHSFHVSPFVVLVKSESSHTTSAVIVLDVVVSDPSDVHFEEQGEFGVTDRAYSGSKMANKSNKGKEWTAISNGLCEEGNAR